MATFLVEIKCCMAPLERSQWRSNYIRLFCNVPGRDQMLYGSIITFLVEIKVVMIYSYVPSGDQMM